MTAGRSAAGRSVCRPASFSYLVVVERIRKRDFMKKMSIAPVLLAFTAACGRGNPPTVAGPDPQPSAPPPVCRSYATAFDRTTFVGSIGSTASAGTCTFDRASSTLMCEEKIDGSNPRTITRTSTYASTADFVEEAMVVGRVRVLREFTVTGPDSSGTNTFTYDGQKRLTGVESLQNGAPFSSTIYTAWDAQGRAVATSSPTNRACTLGTMTYDDVARTVTSSDDPSCSVRSSLVVRYDAAGNLVELVSTYRGTTSYSTTDIITGTGDVCL
jgi:hypothetical protein